MKKQQNKTTTESKVQDSKGKVKKNYNMASENEKDKQVIEWLERTKMGIVDLQNNDGMQVYKGNQQPKVYKEAIIIDEIKKSQERLQKALSDAKEEGIKIGMVRGLALAINYMYRGNDAAEIWRSAGLTIDECIACSVDDYDMEMILQYRNELE